VTILYDLVDPAEMTAYARQFNEEVLRAAFVLDQILPNVEQEDLEFRVRKGQLQDVDIAEFRAWDTQPRMLGRPGVTRMRGELPPLGIQIPLLEEESLRLRRVQANDDNPIIDAIYDDVERVTRSIQGRVEAARADALLDGVVTISENGVSITVDFGMSASHRPVLAGGAQWTTANAATAKPIDDILGWLEIYSQDTGTLPRGMMMSRTRFGALAVNAQMLAYAQAGAATAPTRLDLATINQIFGNFGIPPITNLGANDLGREVPGAGTPTNPFYDVKVRINGVQTPLLPTDKVLFVPPTGTTPMGSTFFGTTAEAISLIEKNKIQRQAAPGITVLALQNESPVQTFTVGSAIALPVIVNPEYLFTADVA
jgi:hypothetical protein